MPLEKSYVYRKYYVDLSINFPRTIPCQLYILLNHLAFRNNKIQIEQNKIKIEIFFTVFFIATIPKYNFEKN